jgi:hypothetical protein
MQIVVNVSLGDGESLTPTPDEAAAAVITALGGNPATDSCIVYQAVRSVLPGLAGAQPEPTPP